MDYIDTDVLIHSLVNQNLQLHLQVNDLIKNAIQATGSLYPGLAYRKQDSF